MDELTDSSGGQVHDYVPAGAPLLGVLLSTGGLTRVVDKRHVRPGLAAGDITVGLAARRRLSNWRTEAIDAEEERRTMPYVIGAACIDVADTHGAVRERHRPVMRRADARLRSRDDGAEELDVSRQNVGNDGPRLVGVVGVGAMGSGIAQVAVTAGDRVRFYDTAPGAATRAVAAIVERGKSVVRCTATPGFIVNRIARPFYGEAWRLIAEGVTTPATIDAVLTGAGGFRMGPCAVMDLVGHDVNDAVTRSVWTAFGYDPRFAPSPAQRTLIEAGRLGRKTGWGLFDHTGSGRDEIAAAGSADAPIEVTAHGDGELATLLKRSDVAVLDGGGSSGTVELPSGALVVRCGGRSAAEVSAELGGPVVLVDRTLDDLDATAVAIAASPGCTQRQLDEAVGLLQAAGLAVFPVADTPGLIVARTVAMLVNVAVEALLHGVATPSDIDVAMELGTNYPLGPLTWGDRWGPATVLSILDELAHSDGDPRYRASSLLRRVAAARTTFR
jgi:3-hydroxyacyl-CoA dehydrogenase